MFATLRRGVQRCTPLRSVVNRTTRIGRKRITDSHSLLAEKAMKARYVGMGLTAVLLIAAGWHVGQPAWAQQEEKTTGRYQVVGAGLITAVLFDAETGKTWALAPGGFMGGPGNFGGPDQEFAWAPVAKFDDLESYRRWVK